VDAKEFKVRFLDKSYEVQHIKEVFGALFALVELNNDDGLIGLDTETCAKAGYEDYESPGLSPIVGTIRLLQIFSGGVVYLFDMRHLPFNIFKKFLETKRFIAHNALFDLGFLKAQGIEHCNLSCTFIAARLLMHAKYHSDTIPLGLAALTKMLFKEDILKVLQNSDWGKEDLTFEQLEYAALDPICVVKIAEKLGPEIAKRKLNKVFDLYKASIQPISEMELNGIKLDVEKHKLLINEWRKEMLIARQRVLDYTKLPTITGPKISAWLTANLPTSIKAVWTKTPSGKLATDADTFLEFSDLELVEPFIRYQKYEKLLSTYGTKLLTILLEPTGRLHPHYNIAGARTGRLSCSNPNIQNQPREKEFRELYIPESGYKYVCADFSQIEVRVAAEVSKDPGMLRVYENGQDIYLITAALILGKPVDSITKTERQYAKAILLGSQFGLGAKKFSKYAKTNYGLSDITEDRARELIEGYRQAYPVFREWQIRQTSNCEVSLKASTYMGKTRALDPNNYYGMALNHPIQGTAAEIILQAIVNFKKCKSPDWRLIACVHDEILTEVPENQVEIATICLETAMIEAYKTVMNSNRVNKLVSIKTGFNWGEAH